MVVLLRRCRMARLVLRLRTFGPRVPRSTRCRVSSVRLTCRRRPCARNSPRALPSGSKPGATVPLPLINVRVQWSTRHQHNAAQRVAMREFLLSTLSSLSDALASAQWREDWIPPGILDHNRFRQAPMPADHTRVSRLTTTIECPKSQKIVVWRTKYLPKFPPTCPSMPAETDSFSARYVTTSKFSERAKLYRVRSGQK